MRARAGRRAKRSRAWLALALLLAVPAAAQEEIASHRSGPYLGVNAGAALPAFDGEYFFTPPAFQARVSEEPSLEFVARAGWRLLPWLAIEAQYEWVDQWKIETKLATCAVASAQIATGNLRVFAPFEAVHPYLLGGAGAGRFKSRVSQKQFDFFGNQCTKTSNVDFSEDEWEPAFRVGGGFDVYVTRGILFNLEVSSVYSDAKPFGEDFPFVSVSGGLGYRF